MLAVSAESPRQEEVDRTASGATARAVSGRPVARFLQVQRMRFFCLPIAGLRILLVYVLFYGCGFSMG